LTLAGVTEAGAIATEGDRGSLVRCLTMLVRLESEGHRRKKTTVPGRLAEPWLASVGALYATRVALASSDGRVFRPWYYQNVNPA
jgi:hypothetical protein